jgi:uncharacterized protein (TIGR02145 family)
MKPDRFFSRLVLLLIGSFVLIIQGCSNDEDKETPAATGKGCEGVISFEYYGKIYSTVEIGGQCWMAENLNIGNQIAGDHKQTNNDTIEKYCYDNDSENCATYGGLYQWDELMKYSTSHEGQSICPDGWHVPTDDEWKTLEGTVDSQYGLGDEIWNENEFRGNDCGRKLKSTTGWISNGSGTNLYGFTAIPGGYRSFSGLFDNKALYARFWTSTEYSPGYSYYRYLYDANPGVFRNYFGNSNAFSVRCIKN